MAIIQSIIRAKGGTAEREVRIDDIVICDIRSSPLFLADQRWIGVVARYYGDLVALLTAVREDGELPEEFFVPDLWSTVTGLPTEESEMVQDVWTLGHDLAKGVGYKASGKAGFVRNEAAGTVYVLER